MSDVFSVPSPPRLDEQDLSLDEIVAETGAMNAQMRKDQARIERLKLETLALRAETRALRVETRSALARMGEQL
jgi:hypothetical protein